MAAELGVLSSTQLQKLAQSQEQNQQQSSAPQPLLNVCSATDYWMWNAKQAIAPTTAQDDDDSWEVRAFEEDTGNAMGTTWPPRSYTCTFCRREFRSAQALGGHMNVHRRDRARLHQALPQYASNHNHNHISSPNVNSALLIPTQEFVANGGLCLLYSLPNTSSTHVFNNPTSRKSCTMNNNSSSSTLNLSISPYLTNNNLMSPTPYPPPPSLNFPTNRPNPSINTSSNTSNDDDSNIKHDYGSNKRDSLIEDTLDLELRLGWRSSSSTTTSSP